MSRKYEQDPSHVIDYTSKGIRDDMSYVEQLFRVLDQKYKVLRTKFIPLVKILRRNYSYKKATWEGESNTKEKYTQLFPR